MRALSARNLEEELQQILDNLGLGDRVRVEKSETKGSGNDE